VESERSRRGLVLPNATEPAELNREP
jgi:hypothetical protein